MDNTEDFFKNYRGKYSQYWIERWGLIPELPTSFDNANSIYELMSWLQRAFKNLLDDFQQLESEFEDFKNALIDLLEYLIPELIRRYSNSEEFRTLFLILLEDILSGEERNWVKDLLKELLEIDMRDWIEVYLKELYGRALAEISEQLEQVVQYNPKNYGAVGDGTTDDTQAFHDMVSKINLVGNKVKVTIPSGIYVLTEGLHFENEVEIVGDENTWIDYQGTGTMLKLGKDGITELDYKNYKRFEVKGVGFTGGSNMSYGIYTNKFITQPRILNCNFENFGNANAWGIYFDDDCWDGLVQGCRWDDEKDGIKRNFISMYGRGNSRVRVYDNLITSLNGLGTAVYLNGFNNEIKRNKIEGFLTNVRLGGLAGFSQVIGNYFEKSGSIRNSGAIEIGSVAGDKGENATPTGIIIDGNYANTHLTTLETPSYFIKPTKATDLIKEITVINNYVNSWNATGIKTEFVNQNNLGGQSGNVAYGNKHLNISSLHTIGVNIANWSGMDAENFAYNPIGDYSRYIDFWKGNSKDNQTQIRVRRFDGSVAFMMDFNDNNETSIYNNGKFTYKLDSLGRIGFGATSINADYDFNGDIRATHLRVKEQRELNSVEKGSIFEDTDGKLKYKNLAGSVTDLTL